MSFADSDGPRAKRRRFFTEKEDVLENLSILGTQPGKIGRLVASASSSHQLGEDSANGNLPPNGYTASNGSPGFDQDTFESIVGDKLSKDLIQKLRGASGDKLERAVNLYLDGTWENNNALSATPNPKPITIDLLTKPPSIGSPGQEVGTALLAAVLPPSKDLMPEHRYVGAFGCEGWTTRSGRGLLKHGEPVRIERQKIQPPKPPVGKNKGKNALTTAALKLNPVATKRVDVLVRFTNKEGEEVGRLSQNHADWVSTLMDQKICRFEGTCVYAPERLRSGDTVFLQLRCSLLRTAFDNGGLNMPQNRKTGLFVDKESSDEKQLRQRQVALVKLFSEINLLPSQTSEISEKHKHEGLLHAAEVSEQHEQHRRKVQSTEVVGSPPSEDLEDGKELEQDQLDTLYRKAQTFDLNAPAAEPAHTFAMDLRHYQKQALHWMVSKEMVSIEKSELESGREVSMHPLWEQYSWPIKDMDNQDLSQVPNQDKFFVNPYSGELSLQFPVQEQNCLGGILADEMGLGKTIEVMSLVHSHKSEVARRLATSSVSASVNSLTRLPANTSNVEYAPCTTLVIAPMSLLAQWQSEAENASKDNTIKIMVYYGSDKTTNLQALCCEANAAAAPNVLITSYGVILSEFNQVAAKHGDRGSHGGLFSLKYFRVILDEAHYIKNRQSKTAKACYEIEAEHRWVLTGTPIVNRLEDLFSLVRFLRVEPWSNFSFWRTFITVPFESKDFMRALDVVQTVLEPLVLRRTKDMKTPSGEALVSLPAKKIEIIEVELSEPEREVYDHIFKRAKRTFAANVEAGTVFKAYTSIFAQILRLRQSCCHPILTRNQNLVADEEEAAEAADLASGLADDMDLQSLIDRFTAETDNTADANTFGAHVLAQIRDEAENECPICSEEPMIEHTVTNCWHSACKGCLLDYIKLQADRGEVPRCFSCREVLNTRDIFEVVKEDRASDESPRISLQRLGSHSSAKMRALLTHLKGLRTDLPGTKSVVFSQFTSFLSLIESVLDRAAIPFLRLDGSMSQKARAAVLAEFATSSKGFVLLLSLRAGGVGLNLTMAKRVYMMDPWWSFAIEAQAIDRVHRMGQTHEVKVYRFIVKESVEERMLKIQERKKFIAGSLGMMSGEEKKLQRIEDIKVLLS